ncbi:MAG: DNA-binding protein [Flavobacteriales bacterium]|nr:MAG: DNA-binding protein [Flavobacteriales bacterium]
MNAILLNTAEAAEVLRVAAITLHRWRNSGKGPPYVEMGRKVYYRRADLDRWIEEQQRQPQARVDTAA